MAKKTAKTPAKGTAAKQPAKTAEKRAPVRDISAAAADKSGRGSKSKDSGGGDFGGLSIRRKSE